MRNSKDNTQADFFVLDCPDWVNIVAFTDQAKLILIRQFRHGIEGATLEIPGGMVDPGESSKETAIRELEEETGFKPGLVFELGSSLPNPAIQSNRMHHYLAINCQPTGNVAFDEHESIEVELISKERIRALVEDGTISHSLVLAALLRFEYYQRNQESNNYES